jgi:hypothetical protein
MQHGVPCRVNSERPSQRRQELASGRPSRPPARNPFGARCRRARPRCCDRRARVPRPGRNGSAPTACRAHAGSSRRPRPGRRHGLCGGGTRPFPRLARPGRRAFRRLRTRLARRPAPGTRRVFGAARLLGRARGTARAPNGGVGVRRPEPRRRLRRRRSTRGGCARSAMLHSSTLPAPPSCRSFPAAPSVGPHKTEGRRYPGR